LADKRRPALTFGVALDICTREHTGVHVAKLQEWEEQRAEFDELPAPEKALCLGRRSILSRHARIPRPRGLRREEVIRRKAWTVCASAPARGGAGAHAELSRRTQAEAQLADAPV
jgi:hypothetical protein